MDSLEKAKSYIMEKKKKLIDQEKELRQKEKMIIEKKFSEIGRLAYKAEIMHLDKEVLLGAFLELKAKSNDHSNIDMWRKKAESLKASQENSKLPLSICFQANPPQEIKDRLKELKFKWNSFHGEYNGYGEKKTLLEILKGCQVEIKAPNEK